MSETDAKVTVTAGYAPAKAWRESFNWRHLLRWKWVTPLLGLILVMTLFASLSGNFLTVINMKIVFAQTVLVAVAALGMTFVMVGGGIDLSVGSVMALAGVVLARVLIATGSPWQAVGACILVGGFIGLLNAVLITGLRIVPFIVTLGMMSIARGLAKSLARNSVVRPLDDPGLQEVTAALRQFGRPLQSPAWWDFAPTVWMMLGLVVVAGVLLNMTRFGRWTFAIGSNEEAARFSGIPIDRHKWRMYTFAGLLTGVSGVVLFASTTQGDPTAAVGIELQVIAAVVIGGGSLMGGQGSIVGTLLGAFMLTFLVNGCTLAGWPNWVQEIIIGLIIVGAVALDYLRRRLPG